MPYTREAKHLASSFKAVPITSGDDADDIVDRALGIYKATQNGRCNLPVPLYGEERDILEDAFLEVAGHWKGGHDADSIARKAKAIQDEAIAKGLYIPSLPT